MFFFRKTPTLNYPLNLANFDKTIETRNVATESKDTGFLEGYNSHWNLPTNAKWVFLEVTNYCNFRCHFCPSAISKRDPEHMDTKLAEKLVQQLHELGYRNNLYFHLLGEPLLHPDIFEILRFASKKQPRTILFTNGSLLTKDNIESVFNACPYEIVISMQLADEQTFSLRGSSTSWDQYVSRIRDTVHYKLTHATPTLLRISVGIRKEDSAYPQDDYFPRVSSSDLRANLFQLFSDIHDLDSQRTRELLSSIVIPFKGSLGLAPGVSVSIKPMGNWRRIYTDERVEKGYCPHFGKEFGILSNGSLVYCHLDYDGKTAFANARYDRLRDIFKRSELQREIKEFITEGTVPKGCQHCIVPSKWKTQEEV